MKKYSPVESWPSRGRDGRARTMGTRRQRRFCSIEEDSEGVRGRVLNLKDAYFQMKKKVVLFQDGCVSVNGTVMSLAAPPPPPYTLRQTGMGS